MKKHSLFIALGLIGLSVVLHFIHVRIFHDPHHMLMFLMGDIAFVPLEVFLVSVVIDRFIERREHQKKMSKSHMLVGLFYQELGTSLLRKIVSWDRAPEFSAADVNAHWGKEEYGSLTEELEAHDYKIGKDLVDFDSLYKQIDAGQQLIISLITNPVLGEHESFSDSLLSVFHLLEELNQRDLSTLADDDISHLKVDIERVYRNLALGWTEYMAYLQKEYPFLFASAVRTNPFTV
jgi:hypothetical protein